MQYLTKKQTGFTLIEISLTLLLLGVLLMGSLQLSGAFKQVAKSTQAKSQMLTIKAAMLAYLKVNQFLPCPDTSGDGEQNTKVVGGVTVCQSRSGTLPYKSLQIEGKDPWHNPFYYRVNARSENKNYVNDICQTASVFGQKGNRTVKTGAAMCPTSKIFYCGHCSDVCSTSCDFSGDPRTVNAPPYFNIATPPNGVENADGFKNMVVENDAGTTINNGIVAMVVSFGSKGQQISANCNANTTAGSPERENCNGDANFALSTLGKFDNYLTWLTIYDVKQAIMTARGM